jgi:hypothetical protein
MTCLLGIDFTADQKTQLWIICKSYPNPVDFKDGTEARAYQYYSVLTK